MTVTVSHDGKEFIVVCQRWDNDRVKMAPKRKWEKNTQTWRLPSVRPNALFLLKEYSKTEIDPSAKTAIDDLMVLKQRRHTFPAWYKFKTDPRSHQNDALNVMWPNNEGALFMEMRTGKSWVLINLAAARAMNGDINALVVIAPTFVKPVWPVQIEEHCPIETNVHILQSGAKGKKDMKWFTSDKEKEGFKILIVGIEALSQGGAFSLIETFILSHKCMVGIDESSYIKNDNSTRTKNCYFLGGLADYRYVLTGTPITQGIEDLYAQFTYLNSNIIGMNSYYTFRNRYCVMGGFEQRKIIGYRSIPELMDLISPYVYQVNAKDVIDLPPKIYEQRYVPLSSEQKKAIDEIGDSFNPIATQDDKQLEVETVLERMMRHQQICGGLFPFDDTEKGGHGAVRLKGKNNKLIALLELIEEARPETKIIIWATFRPEIDIITETLTETYGAKSFVEYHGGTKGDDARSEVLRRFQNDDTCKFFISNKAGSMGLELSAASMHIFYSNSFSYDVRKQQEARTNSSEQEAQSILYVDIWSEHDTERKIEQAQKNKQDMANYVNDMMAERTK